MTSDVILPHYFILTSIQGNFHSRVHATAKCFYFNLNVLKFELQYKWTPPIIFFCGYRILQLFCDNGDGAETIAGTEILLFSETWF